MKCDIILIINQETRTLLNRTKIYHTDYTVTMQQQKEQEQEIVDVYYVVKPIFYFSRFCGLWIHSLKVNITLPMPISCLQF